MESNSNFSGKKGKKLRQFSGESSQSTRSEPTEASSAESDFDPSNKTEGKKQKQKSSLKFSSLTYETYEDCEHRSAFLPYRPRTVLTNLQRGNVQTEAVIVNPVQLSIHQRAGKGELTKADMENGGFDVNGLDERGLTPLMWSAAYGQVPTAQLLMKAGALHSTKGPDGETAIHLAASGGHTDILRCLMAAGASANETDDNSNTPLMFAAYHNHPHAVNELLNHHADLTITNLNDDTALSIAIKRSCKDVQSVIEGYLFMLLQPS